MVNTIFALLTPYLFIPLLINGYNNKYICKFLAVYVTLFFVLFYGMRGETVGSDTAYYFHVFNSIDDVFIEPGFSIFIKLVRFFTTDGSVFLFSATFASALFFFLGALKLTHNSDNVKLPLFILFVFTSFATFDLYINAIRQGLGLSLFFFAATFFLVDKNKKSFLFFLLLSALAILVHYSIAILLLAFLLAIFFRNSDKALKVILLLNIFLFVLCLLGVDLVSSFVNIIRNVSFLNSNFVFRKVINALSVYSELDKGSINNLNLLGKLQLLAPLIILNLMYFKTRVVPNDRVFFLLCSYILAIYFLFAQQAYSFRYLYLMNFYIQYSILILLFSSLKMFNLNVKLTLSIVISMVFSFVFLWNTKQAMLLIEGFNG
ncbi:EpsG family protein [Pseudoalteromonas sp. NZS11_1]|uniref:EpsG family protein n=1 Tax=Pseudoalteromonas sp. NZS11_1 TaxID=2792070 RepID=UPI0018CF058D|nr:EpsG family protein [Pseudoalteromonas sp. NZS11_1]MBH0044856.1 EpsG family protein [Pseudoalteromonas sp. NZS11_1]